MVLKRSSSAMVPPTKYVELTATLPYTWAAGKAVTTMSLRVRPCIVAVCAQLRNTD